MSREADQFSSTGVAHVYGRKPARMGGFVPGSFIGILFVSPPVWAILLFYHQNGFFLHARHTHSFAATSPTLLRFWASDICLQTWPVLTVFTPGIACRHDQLADFPDGYYPAAFKGKLSVSTFLRTGVYHITDFYIKLSFLLSSTRITHLITCDLWFIVAFWRADQHALLPDQFRNLHFHKGLLALQLLPHIEWGWYIKPATKLWSSHTFSLLVFSSSPSHLGHWSNVQDLYFPALEEVASVDST